MIHFLANIPDPAPGSTESWLWNLAAVMAIIGLGLVAAVNARKLFARRPPVEDELSEIKSTFVTGPRLEAVAGGLKRDIDRVDYDLQGFKKAIIDNGESRKQHIVAHVEELRRELKRDITEGRTESRNDANAIGKRIDDLPAQLIATLKNTGAIDR